MTAHYNWGMKKLVFMFDIDGTLLSTAGAGGQAMGDVITGQRGSSCWRDVVKFSGRTDRSLFAEFFDRYGIEDTRENFARYRERFLDCLKVYLPEHEGSVLPDVGRTLDRLRSHPQAEMALLTGNLRKAARCKLSHFGLADYFYGDQDAPGGFGDDHISRDDVAADGLIEVRERLGPIPSDHVWVIGDTPADVQCGRSIGANVLAVATGNFGAEQLAATGPDVVIESFADADAWWHRLDAQFQSM